MRYQLVLQWPAFSIDDYDRLVEIEDRLLEKLSRENEVDGHDLGLGEANIFILTDDPRRAFNEVQEVFADSALWDDIRVAYREVMGNEYTVLWPMDCATFTVA